MWDSLRNYVRAWDWRLFLFILLFLGLPNFYQLYRVRLIGNELPDPGSLAIVSQWQFVGLTIEVFQEATVLAIFFFLGSQIRSSTALQLDRAKSVFTFIFLASLIFSAGVFLFRDAFITVIGTPDEIQQQTRSFLGISIFSVPFTMLAAAIVVLFEALGLRRLVFAMAIANVGFRFVLDSLFFGGHAFSLQADVTGVGWSTLLASLALFLVGLVLLFRTKSVRLEELRTPPSFADMREYLRVGLGSGVDSLVRNLAYFFMIVRIVNTIGTTEIGGYYVAIQILWSFMLVPVLAFADSAKALIANASNDIRRVRTLWQASMVITAGMMLAWIVIAPMFRGFAGLLSDDPVTVDWAVTAFGILFVPYVLFSFNTVTDSVFYGIGLTKYMAYQSILTNGTVYLVAFLLYVSGTWEVTFEGVMFLFALGILVDSFLTLFYLVKALYVDPARQGTRVARPVG
ncbi:MAG: MATE family efflux transporter [Chloroflexota bacterium]|nr:MATE family efflux transporter [Chloroflexota bacterium]MDE2883569.1 MATE family efflux transporter [Chloroflexota bacterium]